jgi:RNA polymerase-binding transcription factor DksA
MLDARMQREPTESTSLQRPPQSPAPPFPPRELERIERRLLTQRTELLEGIARHEASPSPRASAEPSPLAILRGELDNTTHALERLACGRYGTCERCGGPIPLTRLRIIPSATTCGQCTLSASTARDPVH